MTLDRSVVPELMDQAEPDPRLLAESLADLAWLNRYLGGTATVTHHLRRLLIGYRASTLRVLDVGAGGGDMLLTLCGWCRRRGLAFQGVGLERGGTTVRLAREHLRSHESDPSIGLVRGDARALPFGPRSFDIAISSTTLHHLRPDEAVVALAEMSRVSDWGIVVSDLRRTVGGYLSAWLLARTLWRHHEYARHDGPASIRAAYTLDEARALADRAGLTATVVPQPFFRWAMRWKRDS